MKFSKEGKYLFEWGTKEKDPGQFDTPNGIDLDAEGTYTWQIVKIIAYKNSIQKEGSWQSGEMTGQNSYTTS